MSQLRRPFPQRNHTSLDTNGLELRPIELIRASRKFVKVDVFGSGHLARMNLEDTCAGSFVRQRELDLTIKTTRAKKCRVEDVDSVCRSDNLR